MKNKLPLIGIFLLALAWACTSNDPAPSKMVGTWKLESAIASDDSGTEIDFWSLVKALSPCAGEVTHTFNSDGTYSTFVPAGCVNDDDEPLTLLSASGGTYTLNNDTFSIDLEGEQLEGDIAFSGNKAIVTINFTDEGGNSTLVLTFIRQ
ncbi:lipocalin family protein [Marinilongibacter aquaticus]|uniref:lipocalin family protein n=1 Tax=Marinilongibacter aquaticus TaxID=2975157 RepID=UPI0021BD2CE0|nr:lipocalin family protein [Marinilongibacter aquaticus]UBM60479.1 lipocalin family protein [Marinilongibacter aquaticus]